MDSRKELVCNGLTHLTDKVAKSAKGSWIEMMDGSMYLDFTSGIGVVNTGHCHPTVVEACRRKVAEMIHMQINCVWHEGYLELAEALRRIMPDESLNRFLFVNSGAEAVENAVKIARQVTGRTVVVGFEGGYHGRTYAAMALTTSKPIYRAHMGPLPAGFVTAPFPAPHPPCDGQCGVCDSALAGLTRLLEMAHEPSEVAAMIIEPVLGEGGYIAASSRFLRGVRGICDAHGILLVVDEVQTGFGRTGDMFAISQSGVRPDMLLMAKGLASGMPIAAVAASETVMDVVRPGSVGGTYGGNAVACAAAVATIAVILDEDLPARARQASARLRFGLTALQARFPRIIAEIRGRGLMVGISLSDHRKGIASTIVRLAEQSNLLILTAGSRETLRLIPPLNVSNSDIDLALRTLSEIFTSLQA